jgi:hypothetical protein
LTAAATPVTKTLKIDGTTSGSHCNLSLKQYNTMKLSFKFTTKLCLKCYQARPGNFPNPGHTFWLANNMAILEEFVFERD